MKTTTYQIEKLSGKAQAFKERLTRGLRAYTESKAGPFRAREINLRIVGTKGRFIGSLSAVKYWNCLFIDKIWVEGKHRNQGLGKRLLGRAEAEGRKLDCKISHLNSHSLQAPGFYLKMGYKVFGQLKTYPKGQSVYHFFKKL